ATPVQPTATPVQPTATPVQPTATPVQPTVTPIQPTATPLQPTATPIAGAAATPTAESSAPQPDAPGYATSPLPAPRPGQSPLPVPLAALQLAVTEIPATVMFVCGYDRCLDSQEYGTLSFETGISIWENPEPDRGDIVGELSHGDLVRVVALAQLYDRPGGLWYQLEDGGWISDLWLTERLCTPSSLPELSFERCSGE
ncbi:MAG: hypothetical protein JW900_12610, partial [Anaerolineae bacterium]|nr:hypothetical protein [Anaerolineae bacterium]